ncbi:MAG TPA: hypothetical protein V6D25_09530 [Leptolyngbyaceae cyanobacterium]
MYARNIVFIFWLISVITLKILSNIIVFLVNPVFHVYNNDFRNYNFLGGLTPTVVSGLNLVANGSSVGAAAGGVGSNFDNGGNDPNKGRPNGSAYGSFQLTGTFTSISWNRVLNPGD